jgi:hypothetical protein
VSGRPAAVPLADELTAVLEAEPAGLSCDELASRLRRRRGDVLMALRADPCFEHAGRTRGSRWRLAAREASGRNGTGFSAPERPSRGPGAAPDASGRLAALERRVARIERQLAGREPPQAIPGQTTVYDMLREPAA